MYEIDLSTLLLIGIDEYHTRVVTLEDDFIIKDNTRNIIDNSCRFFGSSINDRIKATSRLINISSKTPILIEDSRNIIFFPLKSTREKVNIWISFNHLVTYQKDDKKTILIFNNNQSITLDFSYYIIDKENSNNQVTRSMMLDYEIRKRRESLKK